MTYRNDLQILRGVAVLFVLLYHLKVFGFQNGYLGVDLFFVLSGFLMATLCERSSVSEFYNRRLRRLLPAYLFTILLTTIAVIIFVVPSDANQRFDRFWFDVTGLSNVAFWIENSYFDTSAFKPLLNLWSLGVELQFYVIAPFLLPFLRKRLILTFLFIFGCLLASIFITSISPKTSFFMMPLRLWEFLVGALVAWYPLKINSVLNERLLQNVFLLLLLGVFFLYPLKDDSITFLYAHPGLAAVLVAVLTAFLISLKMNRTFIFKGIVGSSLSKLGDYSYSIYLIHFPVIVLLNYSEFGGTQLGYSNWTNAFMIILVTSVISYFMFHNVESLKSSKTFAKPILLSFISLIILGLAAPSLNKLRFSENQQLIFQAWEDRSSYRCGKIFRLFNPTESVCSIGIQNGKKNVLLLGNSHADSLKVPFVKALDKKNLSTFFYVANNPLLSKQTNAEYISKDVARFDIEAVVLHYSRSFYLTEENREKLADFINQMKTQSVDILLISPVPTYEYHVPKLLYLNSIDPSKKIPRTSIQNYLDRNDEFFKMIEKLGISSSKLFYPHEYLCTEDNCLLSIDGVPVYFDSHHLTISGANILMPIFNEIASEIL